MQVTAHSPKRRKREYTDAERATALATYDRCDGNLLRASLESGVPRKTLEGWVLARPGEQNKRVANGLAKQVAKAADVPLEVAKRAIVGTLDDKLDAIAHRMADVALDKPPEKISARDAMVSMGIAIDKKLLRAGQPTTIHAQASSGPQLTPDQLRAYLALCAEARQAQCQPTVTAPALAAHTDDGSTPITYEPRTVTTTPQPINTTACDPVDGGVTRVPSPAPATDPAR